MIHKQRYLYLFYFTIFVLFVFFTVNFLKYDINPNYLYNKNKTLSFERIYVINLKERDDRKQIMKDIEKYMNLDFTFINAVNYKDLNTKRYKLKKPVLACFFSHTNIYKEIIKNNIRNALILEDDIDVEYNIKKYIKHILNKLPENWDIVYLGHCNSSNSLLKEYNGTSLFNDFPNIRKSIRPYCTHAYAVSNKGAQKLLNDILKIPKIAIDVQIAKSIVKGRLESYTIVPPLFIQSRILYSDISKNWMELKSDKLENSVLSKLNIY
jgi:GR25 family glycosyltransferase involved in LPS biosynthesis